MADSWPYFIILLIASSSLLVLEISGQAPGFQIGNFGVRFRLNCDMVGTDIAAQRGPSNRCGDFCTANGRCAAFTWTNFNNGTCFMKGSNFSRFQDGLEGAVCGYIPGRVADNDPRLPRGSG